MTSPPGDGDDDYKVGYRRPPKHTQFTTGRSGNPKGRPKGTKNLRTDLAEELAEKIVVREGEKIHRVTKQRAMVKTLVNRGIKGETKATSVAFSWKERFESDSDSENGYPTTLADLMRRASQDDDDE